MRIVFEKVPDSEGSSFGCFHAGGRVFDCPYHIHPEVEILHILSGRGLLVVGDHIGRFVPGDLFLLGSGLPHMLCSDPISSEASEPTHIRYAQFKQENFGTSFWEMPEQRSVSHLLAQSARGVRFDEESTARLLPTMDRLWETFGARRLWNLMELLGEMAPATSPSHNATPLASLGYAPVVTHRDSERLNRAIQYMNSHLTKPLQLADVANEAGMSPQAFSRFFHKFMGIPFVEYVTSLRISLACRYLLETDKTIAAVCYACGFNNLSNFNRQFLRHKNTTPKEFKRSGAVESTDPSFFARVLPQNAPAPIAVR
jgi:AraC-like DNA-binding protein